MANERISELYNFDKDNIRSGMSFGFMRELQAESEDCDGPSDRTGGTDLDRVPRSLAPRVIELPHDRVISVTSAMTPDGGWIELHEDITERRKVERQVAHIAHHDALTGLPNRLKFQDEMRRLFKRIERGERQAIACLDLDRFKLVNDTLGHVYGDELLKQVAERLKSRVRRSDIVVRLGGDEFAIVCSDDVSPARLSALAQRMIDAINEDFDLDGHLASVGVSIGIAIGPQDGANPTDLLKAADMALYCAKLDGRGVYRFFQPEMDARMQYRRALEADLRNALPNGQFELNYQPIIGLAADEVVAFEALLRWNHPTRGKVSPADFIPVAEEIGLISDIGRWVINEACAQAARWPDPIKVSVNLSPKQLKNPTLALDIASALGVSGLAANRLELEITEQVVLENSSMTLAVLHQLRQLGASISMDDFGSGYSSLSYLRKFPFDKIKIDRNFVSDLAIDGAAASIVRAVVVLGAGHGMVVTAEGVETQEQLDIVRSEGCAEAQGYLLGRPMPAAEVDCFLRGKSGAIFAIA